MQDEIFIVHKYSLPLAFMHMFVVTALRVHQYAY